MVRTSYLASARCHQARVQYALEPEWARARYQREQCAHAANCEAGTGKLPWPMSPELSPCGPGSDVKH